MNFSQQVKSIREKENLTQEQFAMKLNVTRQAVSNWENDKNLPDIGMLILMSDVFHLSLDELIKGGNKSMNNMTEKIINDGSETKKARYNMISTLVGIGLLLLGILLIVIKGSSVEYVDADGYLHENFFLLPIGFFCMFCGLISFMTIGIREIVYKLRNKK